MISASPEYQYLRDVLGLQAFVKPEGQEYAPVALGFAAAEVATAPTTARASESLISSGVVIVVADKNLSAAESELLKKMLASIAITNFEIVLGDASAQDEQAQGIIFISSTNNFSTPTSTSLAQPSVQIKNFYAMTSEDSHPSETMAFKKAAWAELQNFKKKING
jgi:hypothetical protein